MGIAISRHHMFYLTTHITKKTLACAAACRFGKDIPHKAWGLPRMGDIITAICLKNLFMRKVRIDAINSLH